MGRRGRPRLHITANKTVYIQKEDVPEHIELAPTMTCFIRPGDIVYLLKVCAYVRLLVATCKFLHQLCLRVPPGRIPSLLDINMHFYTKLYTFCHNIITTSRELTLIQRALVGALAF